MGYRAVNDEYCTDSFVVIEHGLGLQASHVPFESLVTIGKAIFADEIIYVIGLGITKIAILVMYCRVFPLRRFEIAAWIIGTITAVWSLMFIFICIFQCAPIPRAWNLTVPGKCLYLRGIFIGNAVPNILTDAIILGMPVYHVWKLHLRLAQRLALTGIFMLGGFVIVASIYRFTTIMKLDPMNLSCEPNQKSFPPYANTAYRYSQSTNDMVSCRSLRGTHLRLPADLAAFGYYVP